MERIGAIIEDMVLSPVKITQEAIRIFPDGLVMGMGVFSLMTLSYSYGVFFLSLLESLLVFHGLRSADSYLGISGVLGTKSAMKTECISGFMSRTIESLTLFGSGTQSSFPSAPLFIVSMAAAYIIAVLYKFSKELEILGETYSSRFYIATMSLPMIIAVLALFRIYFACDGFGVVLSSILIGAVLGALLVEQNYRLFGADSLNIIGIPLMRNRTADGQKIYVCPQ